MRGIVGAAGHDISEQAVRRAICSMRHRGPDGSGVFMDPENRIALGHGRLAIIDLAGGGQPLFSEDRDIVLVCNGEIYDFERLRAELTRLGHVFRTRTDSEVIIHLKGKIHQGLPSRSLRSSRFIFEIVVTTSSLPDGTAELLRVSPPEVVCVNGIRPRQYFLCLTSVCARWHP